MNVNPVFKERVRFPIPMRELERRWSLVRSAMKENNLDSLVMQNDNQWLGGYVRYFSDIPAENAYPHTIIFPKDDEMTIITSGGKPLAASPPEWSVRGVKNRISHPYFRSLNFTHKLDAEETVGILKTRNDKRVGIVGLGTMHAAFYLYLRENLPSVEFIDATDLVDEIKAVKSEDEIYFIRKAAAAQDIVCAAMPSIIKPGKYEYEIRGDINRILEDLGSEEQLIMMSSAPKGQPAGHLNTFFQNRRIEHGDQVFIMIEINGPGGYYGEVGRTWSLGEPSKDLLEVWDLALQAQKVTVKNLKPGAKPSDLYKAHNEFLISKGCPADLRLYAHGQGYDLVERPALRSEETITIKAGMNLAIHPFVVNDKAYAFCCDNYLVNENGCELLHKTPQEIIVLDY